MRRRDIREQRREHDVEKWDVWKVYYMTYAEVEEHGDKPRELVARGLSFPEAKAMAARLGSSHSIHPSA